MSLVSLYDAASLWMTPSGAEDGKLFSQLPTDGSGDFTFSRGSNLAATRVGADGLIEKGRENLLLQSNQFDTNWSKSAGITLTSGQVGYDGSSDAWLVERSAAFDNIYQSNSSFFTPVSTISIYAKAGTYNFLRLAVAGITEQAYFNLTDGSLGTNTSLIASSAQSVGNGWWRLSATFQDGAASGIYIQPVETDGGIGNAGTGSIYIQDAQLEIGLVATDYIESGATTGKAGLLEDEPRFDYSGGATCPSLLLEPSRTNLAPHSEYFGGYTFTNSSIETNDATSPEGLINAAFLKEDTSTGIHFINQNTTASAGVYTASVFAKANGRDWLAFNIAAVGGFTALFNLSNGTTGTIQSNITSATIEAVGTDGWYRCTITADTTTPAVSPRIAIYLATGDNGFYYTGDGTSGIYIYGAQVEEGSYPTSYIPNHSGGSVTRGGEGRVNRLSSPITFGAGEDFTLYFEGEFNTINNFPMVMGGRTTSTAYWWIQNETTGKLSSDSGTEMATYTGGNITINTRHKLLVKRESNVITFYQNGAALTTTQRSGVADAWSFQSLGYGFNDSGSYAFSGKVYQALVFPTALSDAECIALTQL